MTNDGMWGCEPVSERVGEPPMAIFESNDKGHFGSSCKIGRKHTHIFIHI